MGLFDNFKKAEVRSLENPNAPVSAENFLHIMGWGDFQSSAGDDLMNQGATVPILSQENEGEEVSS